MRCCPSGSSTKDVILLPCESTTDSSAPSLGRSLILPSEPPHRLEERLRYLRDLDERRAAILDSISQQGKTRLVAVPDAADVVWRH